MKQSRSNFYLFCITAFLCVAGCKKKSGSTLADTSTDANLTIMVPGKVPEELRLFVDVLSGVKPRMHDQYWTQNLVRFLPKAAKVTGDVTFIRKESTTAESVTFDHEVTDTYRGIEMGSRVFVFRKVKDQGLGVAERSVYWMPVKSYPLSILSNATTEEKIKHCLNTEIYEKAVIGEQISAIDSLDFALHFLPAYGGAQMFFYDNKKMGLVWMAGDIASLGIAAKMKAIATMSRGIVIAAGGARIAHSASNYASNKGTAADGVDAALASLEIGFAVIGAFNVHIKMPKNAELKTVDDLLANMSPGQKVAIPDAGSARYLAQATGRTADDVLASGVTREELAKITQRTLASVATNGVVTAVDTVTKTVNGKTYLNLKKLIPTFGDDVLYGVQGGHAFLIVKGNRIDMGVGLALETAKVRSKSIVENLPTAIVRLKGIDVETVEKLSEALLKSAGKRSITCSQGVCKILSDHAGIITGGLVDDLVPTSVLKNMMDGKFLHGSGPLAGKAIDCDIFITQAANAGDFIKFTNSFQDPVFGMLAASPTIVAYQIADATGAINSFGLLLTGRKPQD